MEGLKKSRNDGLRPNPTLTYYEWAVKYFQLPPDAAIPGKINFKYTPYLQEPLENLSWTSPIRKEVTMKGTQLAFSTEGDILIQGTVDYFPCPVISFHMSNDKAKDYVKRRVETAFEDNPRLKGLIADGYDRKGKSTRTLKMFPGGSLFFVGAESEKNYREYSAALVNMDDVDSFPRDVGGTEKKTGQGSSVLLATARTGGRQGKFKINIQGSPSDIETSIIFEEYKTTDKRKYMVKCPFCGDLQEIDFFKIKFDRDKKGNLKGDPKLLCENKKCGRLIDESYKMEMMQLENGAKWVATAVSDDPLVVGRHMSSAYSLLGYTWVDMCKQFIAASKEQKKGNHLPMVTFFNTRLGLPSKPRGALKKIDHEDLFNKRQELPLVPGEAVIITAAVDIQKKRIEILVVGHSEEGHIYCIEHKTFGGDTLIDYGQVGSPYNDYMDYIKSTTFENVHGSQQPILHICQDMGFNSITASPFLLAATKLGIPITGIFGSTARSGKKAFLGEPIKNKYNVDQREVNVNDGKTMVHNKIGRGLIHFSTHPCFTNDLLRQLTVEIYNAKTGAWENPSEARNELFDLLCYELPAPMIYAGGGTIDWEDHRKWNREGCIMPGQVSQNLQILSKGIE